MLLNQGLLYQGKTKKAPSFILDFESGDAMKMYLFY